MSREFRQVDVFGGDPCTVNPVAVLLDAEDLSDETMRAFSVWSNLSACTFVRPPTVAGADYRVRIWRLKERPVARFHKSLRERRSLHSCM